MSEDFRGYLRIKKYKITIDFIDVMVSISIFLFTLKCTFKKSTY